MSKLTEIINESKYLQREFGEALPTLGSVMKKHQENKFEEDLDEKMDAVGKEDDDIDNDGDSDASDDYLKNRRKVVAKAIKDESVKEDAIRKVIRQEIKSIMKEDEEAFKQPIPATVERFMKKFITSLQGKNLNRKRKLAILGRLVVALKLDPSEVSKYARLVKREL